MDHEGISIDIITSSPGKIKLEHTEVLGSIGRQVPSERSLQSLDYLVQCLCKSLQIPREDCTKLLAEEKYVLTLDYTLKMLNIHERRQCGVPVIIEGETGVGKTALIEMLSKLWNISQRNQILSQKKHFLDYIKEKLNEHQHLDPESYGKALEIIRSCHDCCHTDGIRFIAKLPVEGRESMQFFTFLRDYILKIKANSCIFMEHHKDIYELFNDFNHCGTLETTVLIADAILNSEMRNLFYKLSIHSALTPERINDFFEDILQRADDLQRVCSSADIRTPTIVVRMSANYYSILPIYRGGKYMLRHCE
jgi:Cdc6-like AAA superfamily ATPase